jgi:dipeptidyl aminopeptidase/acylaminoacyl peptidase
LSSGVIEEVLQVSGSITGHTLTYTVHFLPGRSGMPVLFHHYGQGGKVVDETNARIATYGVFCVSVGLADSHCGYELQDYKDAIDDVYARYAEQIDTNNVAIMGVSYGGAVTFGLAVRFPYVFDAAVPIFGVSDFGYDDSASWWVMIERNSPAWGPYTIGMPKNIGDRAKYRDTRYLVRNAIFGAVNNPYTHFEILHDAKDGVGCPGVQVENSRRFVAELDRLGYSNYRYTETPREGFNYDEDGRLPQR